METIVNFYHNHYDLTTTTEQSNRMQQTFIYRPVRNGSHRRLGITLEGMYAFLEEIGFIEWKLPELWPMEWAHRRGIEQREGLILTTAEAIDTCCFCRNPIFLGEQIYAEKPRDPPLPRERRKWIHFDCEQRKVEEARLRRCEYGESLGWRYVESYQRNFVNLSWLPGPLPSLDAHSGYMETSPGMVRMTGYDLVSFLQDWLIQNEFTQLSIAEIILTQPHFQHLRHHVNLATIFWSHIDAEPVIDHAKGTLVRIREARQTYEQQLPSRSEQFWWVDYFCLRQGIASDFNLPEIMLLIQEIPFFIASVADATDKSIRTYISRSFCLFEIFSAINKTEEEGINRVLCYGNGCHRSVLELQMAPTCPVAWASYWPVKRWVGPIQSRLAQTSFHSDQQTITQYIESSIGFDQFDQKIKEILLASTQCDRHRVVHCRDPLCNVGGWYFYSLPCHRHEETYCNQCLDTFNFIGVNAVQCKAHTQSCCSQCY